MKTLMKMLLLAGCLLLPACTKQSENPKWEYKVITVNGDDQFAAVEATDEEIAKINRAYSKVFVGVNVESALKAAGQQGWELVDVIELVETVHPNFGDENYVTGIRSNTRTQELQLIFKRRSN